MWSKGACYLSVLCSRIVFVCSRFFLRIKKMRRSSVGAGFSCWLVQTSVFMQKFFGVDRQRAARDAPTTSQVVYLTKTSSTPFSVCQKLCRRTVAQKKRPTYSRETLGAAIFCSHAPLDICLMQKTGQTGFGRHRSAIPLLSGCSALKSLFAFAFDKNWPPNRMHTAWDRIEFYASLHGVWLFYEQRCFASFA